MNYVSTRNQVPPVSFCEAVKLGLAPDGGLFIPESLPNLNQYLLEWRDLSYTDLCKAFFALFATDIEKNDLDRIIDKSYISFDDNEIAPIRKLNEDLLVLELFHGPTLAFKDFALQLLGNIYEYQIISTKKPIAVLGATSGDTGAAAIHGLLNKSGVSSFIFYPDKRISFLQERQMTCTGSPNVFPLAIKGSFDDAQNAMKKVFEDRNFADIVGLSAVNSINLARILAQCVYYLYAFFRIPSDRRELFTFIVPTGNFGNVLAGWLIQQMGVPIKNFKVATNKNDILHRLFQTGVYSQERVSPSIAPSMDIQIASNFERFLYYINNRDGKKVREIIETFKSLGTYSFKNFDRSSFLSSRTKDEEIIKIITSVYNSYGYVVDPHTACGFNNLNQNPSIILSTAHPAKFPEVIRKAIDIEILHNNLEDLKEKPVCKFSVNPSPESIKEFMLKKLNL